MIKVSVCICTYNQALYLEKAVRSAAEQSYVPLEIIVSDDCSTDETAKVLNKLSNELSILKVVRQPKNLGIAKNTDACLRLAKGDFIIRLDSDDYLSPKYTEKLTALLSEFPEAGYAHASVQEIDQKGDFLKQRRLLRKSGFQASSDALRASIKGYRVAANIIMFRRSALEKVNYISGRPNYVEDYHLTASISAAGFGNVYLDDILSFYRIWIDVKKIRQRRKLLEISGLRQVFNEVIEPAYNERGWSLTDLKSSKANLACRQANCLGWNEYNSTEKKELKNEISQLSSATKVKLTAWLHINHFGLLLNLFATLKSNSRLMFKTAFLRLNSK